MTIKTRKPNHCRRCGKYIEGTKYNPYNVTFKNYECATNDKKMCLKCGEKFIAIHNKYKGGVWELREWEEIEISPIVKEPKE